jgi:hypothetical protein
MMRNSFLLVLMVVLFLVLPKETSNAQRSTSNAEPERKLEI